MYLKITLMTLCYRSILHGYYFWTDVWYFLTCVLFFSKLISQPWTHRMLSAFMFTNNAVANVCVRTLMWIYTWMFLHPTLLGVVAWRGHTHVCCVLCQITLPPETYGVPIFSRPCWHLVPCSFLNSLICWIYSDK